MYFLIEGRLVYRRKINLPMFLRYALAVISEET